MAKKAKADDATMQDDQVSPHGEPVGGDKKAKNSQTRGQNEQDVERRGGYSTGAGEPGRKTPGKRQA